MTSMSQPLLPMRYVDFLLGSLYYVPECGGLISCVSVRSMKCCMKVRETAVDDKRLLAKVWRQHRSKCAGASAGAVGATNGERA